MKTLANFLEESEAENLYNISGELVTPEEYCKEIIDAYNKYINYLSQETCAICDKELTYEDSSRFTPHQFLRTCKVHREYSNHFQASMVRQKLGIKPRI